MVKWVDIEFDKEKTLFRKPYTAGTYKLRPADYYYIGEAGSVDGGTSCFFDGFFGVASELIETDDSISALISSMNKVASAI